MMNLPEAIKASAVPTHDSSMFWRHEEEKLLSQEISTLQANAGSGRVFGSLYGKTGPSGFMLNGAKTGKRSLWQVSSIDRDGEGDILCWNMRPTVESIRQYPKLKGYSITVFND